MTGFFFSVKRWNAWEASPSPRISLRTVSPWLAGATLPSRHAVAASSAIGDPPPALGGCRHVGRARGSWDRT